MRVTNPTDAGVFVREYGVLPPGEEADVKADIGKEYTKGDGPLREVKSSGSSTPATERKGDG